MHHNFGLKKKKACFMNLGLLFWVLEHFWILKYNMFTCAHDTSNIRLDTV